MDIATQIVTGVGALAFGVVVGWIAYRTLRRSGNSSLSDIATVIGAVGGAAVTSLFPAKSLAFGAYCIGLTIGFFLYLIVAIQLGKKAERPDDVLDWLGAAPRAKGSGRSGGKMPGDA